MRQYIQSLNEIHETAMAIAMRWDLPSVLVEQVLHEGLSGGVVHVNPIALPSNFVVIDIETSGLDIEKHGILEIAAVSPQVPKPFEMRVRLEARYEADPDALAVNGFEMAAIPDGFSLQYALSLLLDWLRGNLPEGCDKWIFGNKNPQFDRERLLKACEHVGMDDTKEGLAKLLSRRTIDLHGWAYRWGMRAGVDMSAPGFNTDQLYSALGIEPEPRPHRALQGAKHALKAFEILLNQR